MKKYRVNRVFAVGVYLGVVEANSPQEAEEKAHEDTTDLIALCWSCSESVGDDLQGTDQFEIMEADESDSVGWQKGFGFDYDEEEV